MKSLVYRAKKAVSLNDSEAYGSVSRGERERKRVREKARDGDREEREG